MRRKWRYVLLLFMAAYLAIVAAGALMQKNMISQLASAVAADWLRSDLARAHGLSEKGILLCNEDRCRLLFVNGPFESAEQPSFQCRYGFRKCLSLDIDSGLLDEYEPEIHQRLASYCSERATEFNWKEYCQRNDVCTGFDFSWVEFCGDGRLEIVLRRVALSIPNRGATQTHAMPGTP